MGVEDPDRRRRTGNALPRRKGHAGRDRRTLRFRAAGSLGEFVYKQITRRRIEIGTRRRRRRVRKAVREPNRERKADLRSSGL